MTDLEKWWTDFLQACNQAGIILVPAGTRLEWIDREPHLYDRDGERRDPGALALCRLLAERPEIRLLDLPGAE